MRKRPPLPPLWLAITRTSARGRDMRQHGQKSSVGMVGLHDRPADDFDDLRDDGIAEGSKAVHSSGNPMSHSTHVGFNEPPSVTRTASFNGREFLSKVACEAWPDFQSRAEGVGHCFTALGSSLLPTP